jgi:hypothetical protein
LELGGCFASGNASLCAFTDAPNTAELDTTKARAGLGANRLMAGLSGKAVTDAHSSSILA